MSPVSPALRVVAASLLVSCTPVVVAEAEPGAPTAPRAHVPEAPVPAKPSGDEEPARSASPVPRVDAPSMSLTWSAPSELTGKTKFGIDRVFVKTTAIARVSSLGQLRGARISIGPASPETAYVEVEGADVTIFGSVPLHRGTTDDLVLFPGPPIVRDGWLLYDAISVGVVGTSTFVPTTTLDEGIVPVRASAFDASGTSLGPFRRLADEPPADHALVGSAIALEDDAGKKVATLSFPNAGPPGKPVRVLAAKGPRSRIQLTAGPWLRAEGWVASRYLRKATFSPAVQGVTVAPVPGPDSLTCERDVPLWAKVEGTIYLVGKVHAHRSVAGKLDAANDFRLELGTGAALQAAPPPSGDPSAPFVPRHALAACADVASAPRK